ncbi:MAG: ribonuclease III [Sphingomonadaceae bacterium]
MTESPETLQLDSLRWAQENLAVGFTDQALLQRALTHKTMGSGNYERLEFLGDRILAAIIAVQLYHRFPDESEGKLSRRIHHLVSRETCAAVARTLGVPDYVRLNSQARADGGADSDNILGDVMESLLGAIYLACGTAAVEQLVTRVWEPYFADTTSHAKHPKSAVQEWALGRSLRPPSYELVRRSGPHHSPVFRVRLTIGDLEPLEAEGGSKQEAETRAAQLFLSERGL